MQIGRGYKWPYISRVFGCVISKSRWYLFEVQNYNIFGIRISTLDGRVLDDVV